VLFAYCLPFLPFWLWLNLLYFPVAGKPVFPVLVSRILQTHTPPISNTQMMDTALQMTNLAEHVSNVRCFSSFPKLNSLCLS
jgi:hypothetical protein